MTFNPAIANIGKARLLALQGMIQAGVNDLNTSVAADPITAPLLSTANGGSVLTSHVGIGRLKVLWTPTDASPKGGPLRIRVCSSDYRKSIAFDTVREYIMAGQLRYNWHTSVFVYFHPAVFRQEDPDLQALREEMVLETVSDWLRAGVLNKPENQAFRLTSQEDPDPAVGFDVLLHGMAAVGFLGMSGTAFGDATEVNTLHILHTATIIA